MYLLSAAVGLLIILIHLVLNMLHMESFGYTVQSIRIEVNTFDDVRNLLRQKKHSYRARILSCEYTRNEDRNTVTVCFRIRMLGNIPLEDIVEFIDSHNEVRSISV